jgi:hypothetical protein
MCDYSLENVNSRPARVADRLVTTTFPNTITRGFAAADDVNMAVCLMPGTELAFECEVEYDHPVTHRRTSAGASTARFRELDRYNVFADHDALEFPDGLIVPLTRLVCGQKASVLQLPARAGVRAEAARANAPAQVAPSVQPADMIGPVPANRAAAA